jgi:hypothetical protein
MVIEKIRDLFPFVICCPFSEGGFFRNLRWSKKNLMSQNLSSFRLGRKNLKYGKKKQKK